MSDRSWSAVSEDTAPSTATSTCSGALVSGSSAQPATRTPVAVPATESTAPAGEYVTDSFDSSATRARMAGRRS